MAGDTQPTQPLPHQQAEWVLATPDGAPQRKRTRRWGWIIALLVAIAVGVAIWFIAEWAARTLVTSTIQTEVGNQLSLAPEDVDVTVAGSVLPQLIAGTLDDVTVSSEDVPLGPSVTGDVTVHASGVPVRGGSVDAATATASFDQEQLRALLSTVEGFPAETVSLAEPDVAMSIELNVFGLTIPIGVALSPSAVDGDIVLSPARLDLAGAQISAEDLRSRFGRIADAVLRDWTVCIAEYLPSGVTLADIAVVDEMVVADLDIDGGIIDDAALQAPGTCE
jgi:uncharacterized protein YpmS